MGANEAQFEEVAAYEAGDETFRLVEIAVSGNVEAFGLLYQRYSEAIYRYLFFRLRSTQDAEDLTGQVFLNAWRSIARFEPGKVPFAAWLYTIAHNLLVNYYRNNQRRPETAIDNHLDQAIEDKGSPVTPETEFEKKWRSQALRQAIESLKEEQQLVIYFRFVERRDHNDVARLLGKSEGAVRTIQFRALQALRQLVDEEVLSGEA